MGWNSWNTFGPEINEEVVRETADAMLTEGLKDAGYQYVVIDDFWEADERDSQDRLQAHPERFPSGIKALADYVHGHGLKFGIYSCAGTHTCGGRPASYGYEEIDAQTFADWGVDFLKYDYCFKPLEVDGRTLYRRMGQALRATGRDILFSACEWGQNEPWLWAAQEAGCHMWRTTGDITDNWESMIKIGFEKQAGLEKYAGPNRWNDPDMMIVGMRGKGNVAQGGCTDSEYRVHFTQWCLLCAPLMLGCDVRSMDEATKSILLHKGLIAVNQDPLGAQGRRLTGDWNSWESAQFQVWAKPMSDGSVVFALYNLRDGDPRLLTAPWEAVGIHDRRPCRVQELWTGEDLGVHTRYAGVVVPGHDVRVLRVTPLREG